MDRLDGAAHPRVGDRQEAELWQEEEAGVQAIAAEALHEAVLAAVEALAADGCVNFVAQRLPALERRVEPVGFGVVQRAIEGDPAHHLGEGEVASSAAHFPDALVRLAPDVLEMLDHLALEVPARAGRDQPALARL